LYYLQSRYYNPDWGRFVNADDTDQLSKLGSNSDQLIDANLFAYCGNNPVNGEDQDGHWWGFIAEIGFIAALLE
jgi:RHS repeat-associated protein